MIWLEYIWKKVLEAPLFFKVVLVTTILSCQFAWNDKVNRIEKLEKKLQVICNLYDDKELKEQVETIHTQINQLETLLEEQKVQAEQIEVLRTQVNQLLPLVK